ncbi:MAG: YdcF family protein [Thermodesulfobacteriota bacterium]|nr:YdcF family protein [Thermodesulfobacteriota bacterium]
MKKLISLTFSISVALNVFLAVVLFTPLTEQLYKPLIVDERPIKSDVIVVLSAGAYGSGLPDFETMVRLRKGLILYREGWADRIICAGGTRLGEEKESIAELMRETLILYGVPPESILTQDETINTYNDITYLLKKYQAAFDFNNAVFVTSSYHTYRVKKILKKKDLDSIVASVEPYELYPHVRSERPVLFCRIIREYLAICYFILRGYI